MNNNQECKTLKTTNKWTAYHRCEWCYGDGCIACPSEVEKDAKKSLEPLFVAKRDNPHDMQLLKDYFGLEALQHAFGSEGTGMDEIEYNACVANVLKLMHAHMKDGDENTKD